MHRIATLWGRQPAVVKLLLLSFLALLSTSAVRFVSLTRRLYRRAGERVLADQVAVGAVAPDLLAASALAGRVRCAAIPERGVNSGCLPDSSVKRFLSILRAAESRFEYLWEGVDADILSTRRASLLALLLTVAIVTYGATPTYDLYFNHSNRPGSLCLFLTIEDALLKLSLGLSCCSALYFGSSFFERVLAKRKTCWTYFCSSLKDKFPRE